MVNVRDATPEEEEWIKYEITSQKELGAYYVTQAEKYNDIYTAVYAIYTGLLLLFGLMNGQILKIIQWPTILIFLLPIIAWVIGVFFFFRVMQPSIKTMPPNSPSEIRKGLYESNVEKAKNYRNGLLAFGIGVVLIVVSLAIGSYFASLPPVTATGDVQLVIKDDSVQNIIQIPIDLMPGTNKTVVVSLQNTTDTSYSIRLNNGDTVDLDKTWIQTVIWKTNETHPDSPA
jgi:hypothetical protein